MDVQNETKIVVAADHAGFQLKEKIKESLLLQGYAVEDCGVHSADSANWAEFGARAAAKVAADPGHTVGILVCGSGIGMSIVANKFPNVRAALCHDENSARLARSHNDANVLALGARVVDSTAALKIVAVFLQTAFEGGRHQARLDYLRDNVEKKSFHPMTKPGGPMPVDSKDIFSIVEKQNQWRGRQCINLIASENTPSQAVRSIQLNDFMGRYAEGHPNTPGKINRYYQGTRFIDEIETMAVKEMKELFHCVQAEVRPYSGNNANTAIAMGYLRGGDALIANSTDAGGHISHSFFGIMGRRIQTRGQVLKPGKENSVRLNFFPLSEDRYHIDVKKSIELIEKTKPNLLVMGKSLYLFPDPVKELAPLCRELDIPILYDGAHVLGLIAGGQFQDPLAEGATWLTGSTHKTFPGPQRGVILGNLDAEGEKKYWGAADRGVFPGTSSNHHLYSLPALLVAVREMKAHGRAYAAQICRNAVALARSLEASGIQVEAKEFGYTRSHQVAVNVSAFGGGVKAALALEANDIICNYNMLPGDGDPMNPSGLRLGTQEMTRFGMKEEDFSGLGEWLAEAIKGGKVKDKVNQLRARFTEMQFV